LAREPTAASSSDLDKYSWVDIGSSHLLSEIDAAFLWAQLESAAAITKENRHLAAIPPGIC